MFVWEVILWNATEKVTYYLGFTHDDVMIWKRFPHYWSFAVEPRVAGKAL